ncbi:MAG: hypothetical protein ACKPIA_15635 [Dolichospermum sp.]
MKIGCNIHPNGCVTANKTPNITNNGHVKQNKIPNRRSGLLWLFYMSKKFRSFVLEIGLHINEISALFNEISALFNEISALFNEISALFNEISALFIKGQHHAPLYVTDKIFAVRVNYSPRYLVGLERNLYVYSPSI